MIKTTVLIVGAGPVGLTLANILARSNIDFKIIDKDLHSTTQDRAITLTARTLEHLHFLKAEKAFLEEGVKCYHTNFYYKRFRLGQFNYGEIQSQYNYLLQIAQPTITGIMGKELEQFKVTILRPHKFLHFKKEKGSIFCEIQDIEKDEIYTIETEFLIACDGSRSTVREQTGVTFLGQVENETTIVADINIKNFPLAYEDRHYFLLPQKAVLFVLPVQEINGQKISRVILSRTGQFHYNNDTEILDELKKTISNLGFKNINYSEPVWITNFNPRQFVVSKLYEDKLAYLGDAAHIQSPIGAQGLNTGMQDAYNFGWKLIFVLKNHFDIKLLDTYHHERYLSAINLLKFNEANSKQTFATGLFKRFASLSLKRLNYTKYYSELAGASQLSIFYPSPVKQHSIEHKIFKNGFRFPDIVFKDAAKKSLYDFMQIDKYLLVIFDSTNHFYPLIKAIEKHRAYLDILIISDKESTDLNDNTVYFIYDHKREIHKQYSIENKMLCLLRPDTYLGLVADKYFSSAELGRYFSELIYQ